MNKAFFGLLLSLALTACGTAPKQDWTASRHDAAAVWADNDSELAITVLSYEEKGGGLFSKPERRNFNHQLVVQNGLEGERIAITTPRDYEAGTVYFMKSAGYFVLEAILPDGTQQFSRILPNGNEILIIEGRPAQCAEGESGGLVPHSVIPSPDGRQLAHIYSPSCGNLGVEFMKASNLSFIDGKFMEISEPVQATWHPQGYLILTNADLSQAWRIAPGEEFASTEPPPCITPQTTSSAVSSSGVKIIIDDDRLSSKELGLEAAFGCQAPLLSGLN